MSKHFILHITYYIVHRHTFYCNVIVVNVEAFPKLENESFLLHLRYFEIHVISLFSHSSTGKFFVFQFSDTHCKCCCCLERRPFQMIREIVFKAKSHVNRMIASNNMCRMKTIKSIFNKILFS